jgi:hypothetical protein
MHGPRVGFRQLVDKQLRSGGEGWRPQVTWRVVADIREALDRNDWQGLAELMAYWIARDEGLHPALLPAFQLAEHIRRADAFLRTLQSEGLGADLADECRADITAFRVLADWCEENDRAAAASEARHLFAVLRYYA